MLCSHGCCSFRIHKKRIPKRMLWPWQSSVSSTVTFGRPCKTTRYVTYLALHEETLKGYCHLRVLIRYLKWSVIGDINPYFWNLVLNGYFFMWCLIDLNDLIIIFKLKCPSNRWINDKGRVITLSNFTLWTNWFHIRPFTLLDRWWTLSCIQENIPLAEDVINRLFQI